MNYKLPILFLTLTILTTTYAHDKPQKTAIIIGATSGIGKALAHELMKNNYRVIGTGRRLSLLDDLKNKFPESLITEFMDVEDTASSQLKLIALLHQLDSVDLFIYNAGTWPKGPEDISPDGSIAWPCTQRMITVNAASFVALTDIMLTHFKQQGHGHIVGISSVDAMRGAAVAPLYCATKSFMSTYLEGIRNQCIQTNTPIYVTEIRPGYIKTSIEFGPEAYWVSTPEIIAPQIVESIRNKEKVAYVTRRWKLIGLLLTLVPDFIYNKIGGF